MSETCNIEYIQYLSRCMPSIIRYLFQIVAWVFVVTLINYNFRDVSSTVTEGFLLQPFAILKVISVLPVRVFDRAFSSSGPRGK